MSEMTNNPLLDFSGLPRFGQIEVEHVIPAIEFLLKENRQKLNELLRRNSGPSHEKPLKMGWTERNQSCQLIKRSFI